MNSIDLGIKVNLSGENINATVDLGDFGTLYNKYDGEYTVTPSTESDIVLETKGKLMSENVTIEQVSSDAPDVSAAFTDGTLASIRIADGVTSIRPYFAYFYGTAPSPAVKNPTLQIPDTVETIGTYAFYGLPITEIKLPGSLKKIKGNAFQRESLEGVLTIPASVEEIASNAFAQNTKLTQVIFKGTPTTLASTVFSADKAITSIVVPWAEGEVANAPWGATNAVVTYNAE